MSEAALTLTVTAHGPVSPATRAALIELGNALLHTASSPLFAAPAEAPHGASSSPEPGCSPGQTAPAAGIPQPLAAFSETPPTPRTCVTCNDCAALEVDEQRLPQWRCARLGQKLTGNLRSLSCGTGNPRPGGITAAPGWPAFFGK